MKLKTRFKPSTVDLFYGVLTICLTLPANALPGVPLSAGRNGDSSTTDSARSSLSSNDNLIVKVRAGNGGNFGSNNNGGGYSSRPTSIYSAPRPTYAPPAPAPAPARAPAPAAPRPAPIRNQFVPTTRDSSAFPMTVRTAPPAPSVSAPAPVPVPAAAPARVQTPTQPQRSLFSRFFGGSSPQTAPRPLPQVSNQPPAVIRVNPRQTGASFLPRNDAELSNVRTISPGINVATLANGNRVRYSEVNGTRTYIAAQSTDPRTGASVTQKFNKAGALKVMKFAFKGGKALWTHFHKNNARQVIAVEPNGTRVVSNIGRGGYVQRGFVLDGAQYYSRTYFNPSTQRVYSTRYIVDPNGFQVYAPRFRFSEPFYNGIIWGTSWQALSYQSGWGWNSDARFLSPSGPTVGYFGPNSVYASPLEWITDFVIAGTLADATMPSDGGDQLLGQTSGSITPQMKAVFASQIRQEVLAEQNGNSVPLRYILRNQSYLYLSSEALELTIAGQDQDQECTIDAGDVVQVATRIPLDGNLDALVPVQVVASRSTQSACVPGTQSFMTVGQLLEMKNRFAERVETGVRAMNDQQGQGGIPRYSNEGPTPLYQDATQDEDVREIQEINGQYSQLNGQN